MPIRVVAILGVLLVSGLIYVRSTGSTDATGPRAQMEKDAIPTGVAAVERIINQQLEHSLISKTAPNWKRNLFDPGKVAFDPDTTYFWKLETSKGPIKIELWPDKAPHHVSNTLYLTQLGFYDNLSFHRIIPGFMMQGGCPLGTGSGNPNYYIGGEYAKGASHDVKGILSAANQQKPFTDGSQFFITFQPVQRLDGKHTVYGRVVEGHKTLTKVEKQGTHSGKPKRPIMLLRATIEEVPKLDNQ